MPFTRHADGRPGTGLHLGSLPDCSPAAGDSGWTVTATPGNMQPPSRGRDRGRQCPREACPLAHSREAGRWASPPLGPSQQQLQSEGHAPGAHSPSFTQEPGPTPHQVPPAPPGTANWAKEIGSSPRHTSQQGTAQPGKEHPPHLPPRNAGHHQHAGQASSTDPGMQPSVSSKLS